jgi:F-type H+-transporting ATPase subunit gamma
MPNLKDIRVRIGSVKNTQKITSAMKMVAAAKLRRTTLAISAARPYATKLSETVSTLSAAVDRDSHPLLKETEVGGKALIVIITSDRGLCGGFNATLIRRVEAFMRDLDEQYDDVELLVLGKKGSDYFASRSHTVLRADREVLGKGVKFAMAKEYAEEAMKSFLDGTYSRVFLAYNEFQSAITQHQRIECVLPIEPPDSNEAEDNAEFEFEPSKDELLETLLPRYVEVQVHRALLDSAASEQGSRMTAMDNASKNAKEMVEKLTLQYNRLRQAAITRELVEITSGAEALHG